MLPSRPTKQLTPGRRKDFCEHKCTSLTRPACRPRRAFATLTHTGTTLTVVTPSIAVVQYTRAPSSRSNRRQKNVIRFESVKPAGEARPLRDQCAICVAGIQFVGAQDLYSTQSLLTKYIQVL